MSRQISIDWDDDLQKLVLTCPFWANDVVKQLPAIRWNKTRRAWTVPLTRKNVEQIEQSIMPIEGGVSVTDAAREAMERVKAAVAQASAGPGFPFWYSFKTEPRKYQFKALQKGYPNSAFGLYMDPGTGKSKVFIDFACARRMENLIGSWLIIVKLTLRDNWIDQIKTHASIPINYHLPSTDKKKAFEKWMAERHDFPCLIVGTESFSAGGMGDMVETFLRSSFRPMITLDESSMIASHDAIRSRRIVSLAPLAVFRNSGSGTPIRDNPLNVFMQFEFLDPNIIGIGDFYAFRNRYAIMGGYKDPKTGKPMQVVGYQNVDELVKTISPYVFQVTKDEAGLDLPPKRYQKRVIPMSKEQRAIYDQLRKDKAWTAPGKEEQVIQNALELELRLHQICGGFTVNKRDTRRTVKGEEKIKYVYDAVPLFEDPEKNPKIIELMDILQEYKESQTIIWCMYVPEIEAIRAVMKKRGMRDPALYYGALDEDARDRNDKAFKSGRVRVMIANPQTGSMGLTWVSNNALVVYFSNSNKLEDRVQSEDRAHRIGSTGESVMYIDLIMEKSVDLVRKRALDDKKDLSDYVRSRIRHFSPDDLIDGTL